MGSTFAAHSYNHVEMGFTFAALLCKHVEKGFTFVMDKGKLFCQGRQSEFYDQQRPETDTEMLFFLIVYDRIVYKIGRVVENRSNLSIFYQIDNYLSKK